MQSLQIIKRNGRPEAFDADKIYRAIMQAYSRVKYIGDEEIAKTRRVVEKVVFDINDLQTDHVPIAVVQSFVENRLLDLGLIEVAEQYISYRIQRDIDRYNVGAEIVVELKLLKK